MLTPNAPPDDAVNRFRADLTRLFGRLPDGPIGVAVSGGPDSLALLLLSHAVFGERLHAATVDHRLRPQSGDEAAFVAGVCDARGIDHSILSLDPDMRPRGNLSDWARQARYDALGDWMAAQSIEIMMTAHHADDQLETMIMRLNRASGVAGLSGIRARRGAVARPLLHWRKAELDAMVRCCGITPVDDPSNSDDRYDRARLRKALAHNDWLDPVAAARSADALAQAEDALDWTARAYAARRIAEKDGIVSLSAHELPAELTRRLVLIAMRQVVPNCTPRGEEVERLITGLSSGRTATLAGVKCSGGDFWLFSKAPPHRS